MTERQHPRYAHEATVAFHLPTGISEGRTRNLSRGGLCANLADALPVGIDCEVSIALVFEDDVRSEALLVPARIVWCTEVDNAHQVGVAFRPLDAKQQDKLALYLGYLDDKRTEKQRRGGPIDERFS